MLIIEVLVGNRLCFVLGPQGLNCALRQKVWDNFEANLGGDEQGICDIEAVDPPCPALTNVKYLRSREKFHSLPSSPHPMHVRLTIFSCFASGRWGNSAMLIRFAEWCCAYHTFILWGSVGCSLHLFFIIFWVVVLSFNCYKPIAHKPAPFSLSPCFWSKLNTRYPELLPLIANFTPSQAFH